MSSAFAIDGTITLNGSVTNNTCAITTPGGSSFTVTLPSISKNTLSVAGATAGRTPFAINLSQCSGAQVATYFEPGSTVDFATGRLKNMAPAFGTVNDVGNNVQVQLLGSNSLVIPVIAAGPNNAQTNSQWQTIVNNSANLNYYAEYYALSAANPGAVKSSVQYTIIYQ